MIQKWVVSKGAIKACPFVFEVGSLFDVGNDLYRFEFRIPGCDTPNPSTLECEKSPYGTGGKPIQVSSIR